MTSARAREEDLQILGVGLTKAFEPFFDQADWTPTSESQLGVRPLGMLESQAAKCAPPGNPESFQRRELLVNGRNNQTMIREPTRTESKRAALFESRAQDWGEKENQQERKEIRWIKKRRKNWIKRWKLYSSL
jgi:hypothetical protein